MKAFEQCTTEDFRVEGFDIERRHNKGWPFTQEHFIYIITGKKDDLIASGLCELAHFPEGRKRTNSGGCGYEWHWSVRAVRGGTWKFSITSPPEPKRILCELLILGQRVPASLLKLAWTPGATEGPTRKSCSA